MTDDERGDVRDVRVSWEHCAAMEQLCLSHLPTAYTRRGNQAAPDDPPHMPYFSPHTALLLPTGALPLPVPFPFYRG